MRIRVRLRIDGKYLQLLQYEHLMLKTEVTIGAAKGFLPSVGY